MNVRDRSQFSHLVQVYSKHRADLHNSYLHATAKLHVYLVLDLSQDINDLLQFRTDIFPDESPFSLIYAPGDYEMDRLTYHTLHVFKTRILNYAKSLLRTVIKRR